MHFDRRARPARTADHEDVRRFPSARLERAFEERTRRTVIVPVKEWVPALSAPAPGCLVSPTIAEPCRDTIDGKLDPTQHLLVDAARSVLLQELDLDVVQRIQVREPVAYRAIEQRIILQELAMIRHGKQGLDRVVMLPANAFEDRLS
jgi:hypothetical protein